MKFTPEVITALAVLRNVAENDFERHRLDVLERDLTEPPKVEVIDDRHQRFNGKYYYRNRAGRFCNNITISQEIWRYCVSEIPDGYEVHHVDGNPANNSISNLLCLSPIEHRQMHAAARDLRQVTCIVCGKTFTTRKLGKVQYCSAPCQRKGRRDSGTDDVKKNCIICGKTFTSNRYDETATCSPACASALRKSDINMITVTCACCGKTFKTLRNTAKCCSRYCAHKYYRQRNKEERICVICGNKFITNRGSDAKTCSRECRAKIAWETKRNKQN